MRVDLSGRGISSLYEPCQQTFSYKGVGIPMDYLDAFVESKKCMAQYKKPQPKERVVFDGEYTIYYNKQGKKTVVKRMEGQPYDEEKATMYAILKSLGVKPHHIIELIDNSINKAEKRNKRNAKKLKAKQRKLELEDQPNLDNLEVQVGSFK